MSKLPLDLRRFKKVKSDDRTATLEHTDGHTITIAHHKLSEKLRNQLDNLPMHKPHKYAEGGKVEDDPNSLQYEKLTPEEELATAPLQVEEIGSAGRTPSMEAEPIAQQAPTKAPTLSPPAPETMRPPVDVNPNAGLSSGLGGAAQTQVAGIKQAAKGQIAEANVLADQAKLQMAHEAAHVRRTQQAFNDLQKNKAPYLAEINNLRGEIAKGVIDPERFMNNMNKDSGAKMRTTIGLILSGMGSGLTGGPNPAFNYLQKQIENDIDSQKANLSNKHSLLAENLRITNDLEEAYKLSVMQSNEVLAGYAKMIAGQTADPMKQARALQIAGAADQKSAGIVDSLAISRLASSGLTTPMSEDDYVHRLSMIEQVDPAAAKRMQEKFVPGAGVAAIPVPNETRQAFITNKAVENTLQRAFEFQKEHSGVGTFSGSEASAQGSAISENLKMQLKELLRLGALSKPEWDKVDAMVPTVGSMFDDRTRAKLNEIKSYLRDKNESLKAAYRITPFTGMGGQNAQIRFKEK